MNDGATDMEDEEVTDAELGQALRIMKRTREHHLPGESFEDFCRRMWGLEPEAAERLIMVAEAQTILPEI